MRRADQLLALMISCQEGLTARYVALLWVVSRVQVDTIIKGLREKELIACVGQQRSRKGKPAKVWWITPKGLVYVKHIEAARKLINPGTPSPSKESSPC